MSEASATPDSDGPGDHPAEGAEAATIPAAIADRLRREILTGTIPPGSPIKERDHAERLGISRTPLREAVRILAQEGLVTLRPLRSPLVTDMTRAEALDEVAVLRLLELHGGELACAHAPEAEIAAMNGTPPVAPPPAPRRGASATSRSPPTQRTALPGA